MRLDELGDRDLLALCIYGEARGEPVSGQIGVGCVVRNRLHRTAKVPTWQAILLAPKQFSCFNAGDPNRTLLIELAQTLTSVLPPPALRQAQWIADGILSGATLDCTKGATNYLTTTLLRSPQAPTWATGVPVLVILGNHSFMKAA